jgi:hypothetical protein
MIGKDGDLDPMRPEKTNHYIQKPSKKLHFNIRIPAKYIVHIFDYRLKMQ